MRTVILVLRNDIEDRWISLDPVCREKEIIVSKQDDGTLRYKLGDGVHTYTELPYVDTLEEVLDKGYVYAEDFAFKIRLPKE